MSVQPISKNTSFPAPRPIAAAAWTVLASLTLTGAIHFGAQAQKLEKPPVIYKPTDFVDITAGDSHTCARRLNGQTYCWGLNADRQVGIGTYEYCAGNYPCVIGPRLVTNSSQVEAGKVHTCTLDGAGVARCWGYNWDGQTGTAPPILIPVPDPTLVNTTLRFSSLSAGEFATCGTTTSGIYCWGRLAWTGSPASTGFMRISPNIDYQRVAVGVQHVCALSVKSETRRQVDCWGYNYFGELGIPNTTSFVAADHPASTFPMLASQITAEENYTCAEQTNGLVYCAGKNNLGQLGNGSTTGAMQPQPVASGSVTGGALHGVTTGRTHACALDARNRAWCWGDGSLGGLGAGTGSVTSTLPVAVEGDREFRALAAGASHTCGIAAYDNQIYCWGDHKFGQLGVSGFGGWTSHPVATLAPR